MEAHGDRKRPSERWLWPVAAAAVSIGLGLWMASGFGLDPTNVPQRKDFQTFYFPSMRVFAERPFSVAVADYPAAPFPLFFALGGWLYAATGVVLAIQIWTLVLGALLLAVVVAHTRQRFGRDSAVPWLWLAALLISPYFRGQSVYSNTDTLALLFAFAALYCFGERAPAFPSIRALGAFALAFGAVYTRQFYVFLPAYLALRSWHERPRRECWRLALYCALWSGPALALVLLWGSITPPRFVQHVDASLFDSMPVVVLLLTLYASPLALVSLIWHRRELWTELKQPRLLLLMAPFVLFGLAMLLRGQTIPDVAGGGMPLHALKALPIGDGGRNLVLSVIVMLGGGYLSYLLHQRPWHNSLLLLITLCFLPTRVLYQRYFDPLLPALTGTTLAVRELSEQHRHWVALGAVALELLVSATGIVHYRSVFGPG